MRSRVELAACLGLCQLLLLRPAEAAPPPRVIADFTSASWAGWQNVTFWPWSPKNDYSRAIGPGDAPVLKAVSTGAGSMFMRFVSFDPAATPLVSWRWKITAPVPGAAERTQAGDDAPARVYFVWNLKEKRDLFKARAIGYIWGQQRRVGEMSRSPYTDQIGIVTLRSGAQGAGRWQSELRNLDADYREIFKSAPPGRVTAVAVLTDTDQTDTRASAWYGAISVGALIP